MSGTTTNGLPYPDPTDPLAEGANAIKALALAVDASTAKILSYQSGLTYLTFAGGNSTLTFPRSFPAGTTPVVLLTPSTGHVFRINGVNPAQAFIGGVNVNGSAMADGAVGIYWAAFANTVAAQTRPASDDD